MRYFSSAKKLISLFSLAGALLLGQTVLSETITLTEELELHQGGNGLRQSGNGLRVITKLPVGTVIQVDEATLRDVEENKGAHHHRYRDSNGRLVRSNFAFVPGIRILEFPASSGLNIENFSNKNYYLPLRSLEASEVQTEEEARIASISRLTGLSEEDVRVREEERARQEAEASSTQSSAGTETADAPRQVRKTELQQPAFLLSADPAPSVATAEPQSSPTGASVQGPAERGAYPPICGCPSCRITSPMGMRCHPLQKHLGCPNAQRYHDGNDWAGPAGTPVRAPCDGEVISTRDVGGYGKQLTLLCEVDGKSHQFRFNHLQGYANRLNNNRHVNAGDVVAAVGNTGASTGPHLDIEIHVVRNGREWNANRNTDNLIMNLDPARYFMGLNSRDILNPTQIVTTRNPELYARFNQMLQGSCPDLRTLPAAGATGSQQENEAMPAVQ